MSEPTAPYNYTSEDIVDNLATQLATSVLFTDTNKLNGKVYRGTEESTTRPRNSDKEDCVVIWTSGYAGLLPKGTITLNIFCKDIKPYANGVFTPNFARLKQISTLASTAVLNLAKNPINYNLDTVIHTATDKTINQSFVVVKLEYRYINL